MKSILRMGCPSLGQKSTLVNKDEFGTANLYQLLKDMEEAMIANSGVGIAAPQIGVNKRVILFGFEHNSRYPEEKPVPKTILINPEIEILSNEMIERTEGCLSLPGLRGFVPRYNKLKYTGFSPQGQKIEKTVTGFHARIVQHELDHINGVLFPQRIADFKNFGFNEEILERDK